MPNPLAPILYLPHGGGPLPLMGDPSMANLTAFLRDDAPALLGRPDAILMVSAHWEEVHPTLTSAPNPGLLYDYYGFPPESYQIQYLAPGAPQLAQTVFDLLHESGFQPRLSAERNFDHGMFVPLKLIYPKADIPCVQLSLLKGLLPARHIALGKALAPLRQQNVLIIGSGMSFHNLRAFFSHTGSQTGAESIAFDHWLQAACCVPGLTAEEREQRLAEWEDAPFARYCHPREEHLMPLQVCFGAAADNPVAEVVFNQPSMGHMVSALLWR